jgi:hypothetical protein
LEEYAASIFRAEVSRMRMWSGYISMLDTVNFTPWLLYPWGKNPLVSTGPITSLDAMENRKILSLAGS